MNGFEYTYLSTNEIFEKINYISMDNFLGIIFIILTIFFIIILNNYIFPSTLFIIENMKKEAKIKERRNLLRKIILQKEIENEVERSL